MVALRFAACSRLPVLCAQILLTASAHGAVIHLSTQGNDAWSGIPAAPNPVRNDGPVASLAGAREAVRALKAQGNLKDTVHVSIADGEYALDGTVVFTPADGGSESFPVVYEAAPGAHPVFLGGKRIKGFRAGADGIWKVSIPEASMKAAKPWRFEQLYVEGRRSIRAREPDAPPDSSYDVRKSRASMDADVAKAYFPVLSTQETKLGGGKAVHALTVGPDAAKLLGALDAADLKETVLTLYHNWDNTRRTIGSFTAEGGSAGTGIIITQGDSMQPWNPLNGNTLFHLENFRQALDQPGEWFLDRDGTLYYKPLPGQDPAMVRVFAPSLEKWIRFEGDSVSGLQVAHISLKGLTFRYSQWRTPPQGFEPAQAAFTVDAALTADRARDLAVSDCVFEHTGGYALWFRKGCQAIRVERNLIQDLGAGGVRIGDTAIAPAAADRTGGITVDNNIIRSAGHILTCAVGLWVGQSGDNQVSHNDIGDLQYSAVSAGWTWGYDASLSKRNRFEYNHLHHVGTGLMSDMAAYYGLGLSEGTVVKGNVVHDVYARSYGGWGLYMDEGSSGVTMEDNLVYNCKTGGFHQHYGEDNTVRNNIFAYGVQWQLQLSRVEPHLSLTFTDNIVFWDQGGLFFGTFGESQTDMRKNLFWDGIGDAMAFPDGNNLSGWQGMGHDSGSRVADPLFLDPERYDFRMQAGSPSAEIGFRPFDYSRAGVYGDPRWIAVAKGGEKDTESNPVGKLPGEGPARVSGSGDFRLAGISASPEGGALRLRLSLPDGLDRLEVDAYTLSGERSAHRVYGPLAAGSAELLLPPDAAGPRTGTRLIRLRSATRSQSIRWVRPGP